MELRETDFVNIPCPTCGSSNAEKSDEIFWKEAKMEYQICQECGLKYMNPKPSEEWYLKFYKSFFWQEKIDNKGYQELNNPQAEKGKIINQRTRAKRIDSILGSYLKSVKNPKILEIGSGFGETLYYLSKKYNAEAYAIEPNEFARKVIEKKKLIKLIGRNAEELRELSDQYKFDAIITSHVLENISDINGILTSIKKALKDNGVYFIDTTNLFYKNDTNPYHLVVFTPATLVNMLSKNGFENLKLHAEKNPNEFVNNKYNKLHLDHYISGVFKVNPDLNSKRISEESDLEQQIEIGQKIFAEASALKQKEKRKINRRIVNRLMFELWMAPKPLIASKYSLKKG